MASKGSCAGDAWTDRGAKDSDVISAMARKQAGALHILLLRFLRRVTLLPFDRPVVHVRILSRPATAISTSVKNARCHLMIEPGTVWSIKFPRQDASGRMMLLRTCPVPIETKACALRTMPVCRQHPPEASLVAPGAASGGDINTSQQSARCQKSVRHFHRNLFAEYNHAIPGNIEYRGMRMVPMPVPPTSDSSIRLSREENWPPRTPHSQTCMKRVPPSGGGGQGPRRAGSRSPRSG